MLQFIIGRSGCGKTTKVIDEIENSLTNKQNKKIIYIVPEQQSFATEKELLNRLGEINFQKIDLLIFSRLPDFIFRTLGINISNLIDEGTKNLIMSMAIEQCQDELQLYKGQVKRAEFINLMLSTAKELKLCDVSTDILRNKTKEIKDDTLKQKIKETSIIIDVYDSLILKSYTDPLDMLSKVCDILNDNNILDGYTIYIDGFIGFTKQERNIIEQFLKQSDNLIITLSGDKLEFDFETEIFIESKRTIKQLSQLATDNGVEIKNNIYLNEQFRYKNDDLKNLEECFFRRNPPVNSDKITNIKVTENNDIYEECTDIACQIKDLTLNQGYSYKDITIVCRSLENYKGILNTIFDKFNLSYFMDTSKEIISEPLAVFVLSAFEIITSSFSADSILKFLKCGLNKFTVEEVAMFENYLFIWNITGKKITNNFTAHPRGYVDEFTQDDEKTLANIENIRKELITPLLDFKEKTTDATGLEISKAVYELTQIFNVCSYLKTITNSLTTHEREEELLEQERMWDVFVSTLDQMSNVLVDVYVKPERFAELFKIVISKADIYDIPTSLDQITIGTADRIRFDKPNAVFLIGAIEGEFPITPKANGIFSDIERKFLLSLDLPIYESVEYLTMQEKHLAYHTISAPSEKLYVSYYKETLKGESLYPSTIVKEILDLNTSLAVQNNENKLWYKNLWCEKQAFELMIKHLKTDNNANVLYNEYFNGKEEYKNKYNAIKRYVEKSEFKIENKEISKKLFNSDKMTLSASQVEKYYLCQFQYFCKYGIKAKERKKAIIDSAEFGSLVHYILENTLRGYSVKELSCMTEQETDVILSKTLNQYIKEHLGGTDDKSKRYLFMLEKMKFSVKLLLKHVVKELSQSKFTPIDFELRIGNDGKVSPYTVNSNNANVVINGYVDRVDIYKTEDKSYIRIVDYKTGDKKFVLSDVMFGLNLQMLIYLYAIKNDKNKTYDTEIEPAGVLYMPSSSGTVNVENGAKIENIEKEKEKTYKMNGLILNNLDVIRAMEEDGKGVYIPVTIKEDKPKKGKKSEGAEEPKISIGRGQEYVVTSDEMLNIFNKIDALILEMANALTYGKIEAYPAKGGSYDACKWCAYKSVCGFTEDMKSKNIYKIASPFANTTEKNGDESVGS